MKFVTIVSAASLLGSSYAWKFTWRDADGTPTVESGRGPHPCITINNVKGQLFNMDGEGENNINMLLFTNPECSGEPSGMASKEYEKESSVTLRGFKVVKLNAGGDDTESKTGTADSSATGTAKPTHSAHETAKTASATAAEKTTSAAGTSATAASTSAAATDASASDAGSVSATESGAGATETGAATALSAGSAAKAIMGVVLGMAIWA